MQCCFLTGLCKLILRMFKLTLLEHNFLILNGGLHSLSADCATINVVWWTNCTHCSFLLDSPNRSWILVSSFTVPMQRFLFTTNWASSFLMAHQHTKSHFWSQSGHPYNSAVQVCGLWHHLSIWISHLPYISTAPLSHLHTNRDQHTEWRAIAMLFVSDAFPDVNQ